jgi:hypothetical protein
MIIFDPEGSGNEIVELFQAHSFFVERIPLNKYRQSIKLYNGWINATYGLDDYLITRIMTARYIGIGMQVFGFDRMDFTQGREMLPALLALCHK